MDEQTEHAKHLVHIFIARYAESLNWNIRKCIRGK